MTEQSSQRTTQTSVPTITVWGSRTPHEKLEILRALDTREVLDQNTRSTLVRALQDDSPDVQLEAARKLGELREIPHPKLTEALLHALQHAEGPFQIALFQTIARLQLEEAIPIIQQLLSGRQLDEYARHQAAHALRKIQGWGPTPARDAPKTDTQPHNRPVGSDTLGEVKKATLPKDPSTTSQTSLPAMAIWESLPSEEKLQVLRALRIEETTNEDVLAALIHALQDDSFEVKTEAAHKLGETHERSPAVSEGLLQALQHADVYFRSVLLDILGKLKLEETIPHVVYLLHSEQTLTQLDAATCLSEIGPAAQEAIPYLLALFRHADTDANVRRKVAIAIGKIGSLEAIPSLLDALAHPSHQTRAAAAAALGELANTTALLHDPAITETVAEALTQALQDDFGRVRDSAAWALGRYGPAAFGALDHLIRTLKDRDAEARKNAAGTIGEIGPPAKQAMPALLAALSDREVATRINATWALAQLGLDTTPEALKPLMLILRNDHGVPQRNAAFALGRMGSLAQSANSLLQHALTHHDEMLRANAAWALGRTSANEPHSVHVLVHHLQDPSHSVRMEIVTALLRLDQLRLLTPALCLEAIAFHVDQFRAHRQAEHALLASITAQDLELVLRTLTQKLSTLRESSPSDTQAPQQPPLSQSFKQFQLHLQQLLQHWQPLCENLPTSLHPVASQVQYAFTALEKVLLEETLLPWAELFEQTLFED